MSRCRFVKAAEYSKGRMCAERAILNILSILFLSPSCGPLWRHRKTSRKDATPQSAAKTDVREARYPKYPAYPVFSYESLRSRPVISSGLSSPSKASIVGAMSSSAPLSRKWYEEGSDVIRWKGTGFEV